MATNGNRRLPSDTIGRYHILPMVTDGRTPNAPIINVRSMPFNTLLKNTVEMNSSVTRGTFFRTPLSSKRLISMSTYDDSNSFNLVSRAECWTGVEVKSILHPLTICKMLGSLVSFCHSS